MTARGGIYGDRFGDGSPVYPIGSDADNDLLDRAASMPFEEREALRDQTPGRTACICKHCTLERLETVAAANS